MNTGITKLTMTVVIVSGLLLFGSQAEEQDPGYVDFGQLKPSAGAEFVEVNVRSNLIELAMNLAKKAEPEVAEVLKGLRGVRVNVIGITDENRKDMEQKIKTVRERLEGKGWDRVVAAIQGSQDVGIYVKTRGSEAIEGVVITVFDKKEAVMINVLGDIKPEKLAVVGERFNLAPLKEVAKNTAVNP